MSDYEMRRRQVIRERRWEERLRAMDIPDIVQLVMEMEDEQDAQSDKITKLIAGLAALHRHRLQEESLTCPASTTPST